MKLQDFLSKEEILDLTKPSNLHGFLSVFTTWGLISFSFFMVAKWPNIFTIFVSLVLLGGRHLALAILMHDASHYSLFRTKWLNDFIGQWFCAYSTWQDLTRYRVHHMKHHKYAGSTDDPDLSLIKDFPITRRSFYRKIFRDLIGLSGVKRVYGLLAMDLGFIQYTVANEVVKIDDPERTLKKILINGIKNLHGVVITNTILFLVLWVFGHPSLYILWVASYLTTFSLIVRIRSLAEHAGTEMDLDPLKSTRTTFANPLARVTVAPHYVNYHLEHHILPSVPHQNFKKFHKILSEKGVYNGHGQLAKNYMSVLRLPTIIGD